MKFFVDTAEVAEIRALTELGMVDGVTTNPSLIAKSGRDMKQVIAEICAITPGPVSAEVTATDAAGMLAEGRFLRGIAPNVAVKVPLTEAGLIACRTLASEGTLVNVTRCFSSAQALLAAKAGAAFISPFVGRLDDIATDGMRLIADIVQIYRNYPAIRTEVLVDFFTLLVSTLGPIDFSKLVSQSSRFCSFLTTKDFLSFLISL